MQFLHKQTVVNCCLHFNDYKDVISDGSLCVFSSEKFIECDQDLSGDLSEYTNLCVCVHVCVVSWRVGGHGYVSVCV